MAQLRFVTPVIFGALSDRQPEIPQAAARALAGRVRGAVLLPFAVERRHLRNVVTCMRLMDIMGLMVQGQHRRTIGEHLTSLGPVARASGFVDTVVRCGREFRGESAFGQACIDWLKSHGAVSGQEPVIVLGTGDVALVARDAVRASGIPLLKARAAEGAIILDLRQPAMRDRILKRSQQIAVELLTSPL